MTDFDDRERPVYPPCTLGNHPNRSPAAGVCQQCRDRIRDQLHAIPGQVARLPLALYPTPTPASERVSTSRSAPLPARLDALSMVAAGSEHVTPREEDYVPQLRRWTTTREVEVAVWRDGRRVAEERTITDWHSEPVHDGAARHCQCGAVHTVDNGRPTGMPDGRPLLMPAADDQVGMLPAGEWLDGWVRNWRATMGHHVPARTRPDFGAERRQRLADETLRQANLLAAGRESTMPLVAHLLVIKAAYRAHLAKTALGLHGYRVAADRPDDPLAEEWEARYGSAVAAAGVEVDVRYLDTWLDRACDDDLGIADFADELRALSAHLTSVLGEASGLEWVGRCPAMLTDRQSGDVAACGAGLWQDPHASVIECKRCHSSWGQQQWLWLARQILEVWPIDRKRRYTADDIDALVLPACPGCGTLVVVEWVDATERRDRAKRWRPARQWCPVCDGAEQEAA